MRVESLCMTMLTNAYTCKCTLSVLSRPVRSQSTWAAFAVDGERRRTEEGDRTREVSHAMM